MTRFVVKDLMISVLPLKREDFGGVRRPPEVGVDCEDCTNEESCGLDTCGGCSGTCGGGTEDPVVLNKLEEVADPHVLATLKQQLKERLSAVEARERVVYDSMRPRSADEIEYLKTLLTAALEDLKKSAPRLPEVDSSD